MCSWTRIEYLVQNPLTMTLILFCLRGKEKGGKIHRKKGTAHQLIHSSYAQHIWAVEAESWDINPGLPDGNQQHCILESTLEGRWSRG